MTEQSKLGEILAEMRDADNPETPSELTPGDCGAWADRIEAAVEAEVQRRIADAKKDSDRLQYILRFVWFHSIGGQSYYITLNEENDLPLPNASTDLLSRVDAALIGKPLGDSHDNG